MMTKNTIYIGGASQCYTRILTLPIFLIYKKYFNFSIFQICDISKTLYIYFNISKIFTKNPSSFTFDFIYGIINIFNKIFEDHSSSKP